MRLRILATPIGAIDGISLDDFRVGGVYELRTALASVFLAEGWAELVSDDDTAVFVRTPALRMGDGSAPRVLVVDDDPEIRRLTESLLTRHGYHVNLAMHGRDAIQRLREECPALVVLDLNMPVMDGWQFRTQQRYFTDPERAAVPVVVLTGEDEADSRGESLQAFAILKKPVDPDDLLDAVSAAIGAQISAPDGIQSMQPWKRSGGKSPKR